MIFLTAEILCYRIFDIGNEITLERARRDLAADTRRMKLSRQGSEYLVLPDPPLTAELGRRTLALANGPVSVEVLARIFAHGAVSIILRVPVVKGTPEDALIHLADELYDSRAVDTLCGELIEAVRKDLHGATEAPHLWDQSESYTLIYAKEIEGNPTAVQLLERMSLARLLLGERESTTLSAQEQAEVTQASFSYTDRDLAVIDWNAAFVYEPSGSYDIPDVLEIANAQLLELRYYDDSLDRSIKGVHDGLSAPRSVGYLRRIFRSPYRTMARRVLVTLLEMSEFIERVDNSLKIIGDFYLARIYEGAVKRLRIRQWQASVTRKQKMLGQVYSLLKGDVDTDRALTLEAIIVLLIVFEVVMALLKVH